MRIKIDTLFVNMETKDFYIELKKDSTLEQAQELLQKTSFIYPEEQLWFCNNLNITKLLDYKDWDEKNKYFVLVNNKWYNFKIKMETDNYIDVFYISSRDTINIIKYNIYEKTKILPNVYNIVYNDIILNDDDFVGKYFIPTNSIIDLLIKIK